MGDEAQHVMENVGGIRYCKCMRRMATRLAACLYLIAYGYLMGRTRGCKHRRPGSIL